MKARNKTYPLFGITAMNNGERQNSRGLLLLRMLMTLLLLPVCGLHAQNASQPPAVARPSSLEISVEKSAPPATLYYQNREIVTLRATISNAKPEQRVAAALKRLESIPDFALREEVRVDRIAEGALIMAGSNFIVGLAPADLDPALSQSLDQAAKQVAANVREALLARWQQRDLRVLLRGIALSVLATLIFLFILLQLFRLRAKLLDYFSKKAEITTEKLKHTGLNLQTYARTILQVILRLLVFSLILISTYLWLTFVLRQFPYTYPWGKALGGFLLQSVEELGGGFLKAIPGLLTVVVIFVVTRIITKLVKDFFMGVEAGRISVPGIHAETAGATRRLINVLLWLFALVIAYPYVPGSHTDAFKGISVFVGLMFTLGSAGVINHLMSGLVLVYSRALRKEDYVAIGDVEGIVQEVGPLSVKVATLDRREITIPNTVMTNTNIVNYTRISKEKGLVIKATVTIGYDAPWRQVHELLKLAASKTNGLRKDPEPFVLQTALSDFYVEYKLCAAIERAEERIRRLSELHANIQDAFNEFGVQILSPHFEAQPSNTVVVPKSKWFSAPAIEKKVTKE